MMLMVAGMLVVLIAFNMDVTVDDAKIVNLSLMAERQNLLIIGCVIFISGIILFAASRNGIAQSSHPIAKNPERTIKFNAKVSEIWRYQDAGGKLILISSILALLCLVLYWEYVEIAGKNDSFRWLSRDYIEIKNFIAIIMIWIYPIKHATQKSPANFRLLIICATLSIVWAVLVFYRFYYFQGLYLQTAPVEFMPKMGVGMIVAAIASIFFATGVAVKKFSSKIN